jgi:hypothetical protein
MADWTRNIGPRPSVLGLSIGMDEGRRTLATSHLRAKVASDAPFFSCEAFVTVLYGAG